MALQTTYGSTYAPAYAGMVADLGPATIISRTVEDDDLPFGVAVTREGDHGVSAFGSGDTSILGISVRSQATPAESPNVYPEGDTAAILIKGTIWVQASVAVDAGDPVYVIPATGAFAKTNASSAVQIAGARWDTSTSGAGLARVYLG